MIYEAYPVRGHYPGLGPAEYNGFALGLDDHDYLLDWRNTSLWEFDDSCYDHIQIVANGLKRISNCGRKLVASLLPQDQTLVIFLEDGEEYQSLADELVANDFPRHSYPFPAEQILDIYAERQAEVGQPDLESWLSQDQEKH